MTSIIRRLSSPALISISSFAFAAHEEIDFNRDIRPILSDNCYYCHGPDQDNREGDLRLDVRADAIEAYAIVPGDADDSELIYRIFTDDREEVMPRPSSHKTLSETEKQLLVRWINEGADYDDHWSYTPIERPPYSGIDDIVSKKLSKRNLKLSSETDKRTLIRRASLDIIGLPPTSNDVKAFLADDSPGSYEHLIDRLLDSPHYGEKMAISWLDAVRYADTVGYHGDQERDATPFRDYVITAFNENKPYDQFTIEQIAGDLLPNPTIKQKVAASYNRLNQISREGGIQNKEYIKKYQAERVRTTATAWLGSTMACAECHDHKFDPFTTKDFYSMAAFFSDILEKGAYTGDGSYQEEIAPYLADPHENEGWFGPELTVPNWVFNPEAHQIKALIKERKAVLAKGSPEAKEEFYNWLEQQNIFANRIHAASLSFDYPKTEKGAKKNFEIDLSAFPGTVSDLAAIELEARLAGQGSGTTLNIAISYLHEGETKSRAYYWGDKIDEKLKSTPHSKLGPGIYIGQWRSISISQDELEIPSDSQLLSLTTYKKSGALFRKFRLRSLYQGSKRATLSEEGKIHLDKILKGKSDEKDLQALQQEFFVSHAESFAAEHHEIDTLKAELYAERYTPLTISAAPREVKVLPRGNWMDESGEIVLPASPGFLPNTIASTDEKRLNRLDLAHWIVHPKNPLTARAFVNRIWAQFFGRPLSAAPEDLGLQGEYPEYPELLDWTAAEFIESGWDIKHLIRVIVLSKTYRQSSLVSPEQFDNDPKNLLLARQNPVRLPAEIIRDNALRISGLLNTKTGGKSSRPYQPKGYYANLNFPKREYRQDADASQHRRGVYMHWQRTFLHPMIAAFDGSGRDECVVKRNPSNTPLQALNLLNDPTQVEAARALAEILIQEAAGDTERIRLAYLRALAREPSAEEMQTLRSFLKRERKRFRNSANNRESFLQIGLKQNSDRIQENKLAAFTSLSRAVLNLHETITRY